MEKSDNIVAVIPARTPSSRLPDKNYLLLQPMLDAVVGSVRLSPCKIVVSANEERSRILVEQHRRNFIWRQRPLELMQGESADVVLDAVDYAGGADVVVLLQVTSPLTTGAIIDQCISTFYESGADSLVSVCRTMENPLCIVEANGEAVTWYNGNYYFITGAVYVVRVETLRRFRTFYRPGETAMCIVPKYRSIDVDDAEDMQMYKLIAEGLKHGE